MEGRDSLLLGFQSLTVGEAHAATGQHTPQGAALPSASPQPAGRAQGESLLKLLQAGTGERDHHAPPPRQQQYHQRLPPGGYGAYPPAQPAWPPGAGGLPLSPSVPPLLQQHHHQQHHDADHGIWGAAPQQQQQPGGSPWPAASPWGVPPAPLPGSPAPGGPPPGPTYSPLSAPYAPAGAGPAAAPPPYVPVLAGPSPPMQFGGPPGAFPRPPPGQGHPAPAGLAQQAALLAAHTGLGLQECAQLLAQSTGLSEGLLADLDRLARAPYPGAPPAVPPGFRPPPGFEAALGAAAAAPQPPPALAPRPAPPQLRSQCDMAALDEELVRMADQLKPTDEERATHAAVLKEVESEVLRFFGAGKVRLVLFGSAANGLSVRSSNDLDVCLEVAPPAGEEPAGFKADVIEDVGTLFEKQLQWPKTLVLSHARVPVVKLVHPTHGTRVDITVNNRLACINTKLLADYCAIDPRLAQLVSMVKHWAKRRAVNDPYRGTLSSYCYALMCVHLLQNRSPPVLPVLQAAELAPHSFRATVGPWRCEFDDRPDHFREAAAQNRETLGELFCAFFDFWAWRFDYANAVLCVRTGGLLRKADKGWTKKVERDRHLICIEDPFELSHDLGRTVDPGTRQALRKEFERAARLLRDDPDPLHKVIEIYRSPTAQVPAAVSSSQPPPAAPATVGPSPTAGKARASGRVVVKAAPANAAAAKEAAGGGAQPASGSLRPKAGVPPKKLAQSGTRYAPLPLPPKSGGKPS